MRAFALATLALCLFQLCALSQAPDDTLKTLYERHHWFALRDAIAGGDAPPFYRAAVEAAFDEIRPAKQDLGQIID